MLIVSKGWSKIGITRPHEFGIQGRPAMLKISLGFIQLFVLSAKSNHTMTQTLRIAVQDFDNKMDWHPEVKAAIKKGYDDGCAEGEANAKTELEYYKRIFNDEAKKAHKYASENTLLKMTIKGMEMVKAEVADHISVPSMEFNHLMIISKKVLATAGDGMIWRTLARLSDSPKVQNTIITPTQVDDLIALLRDQATDTSLAAAEALEKLSLNEAQLIDELKCLNDWNSPSEPPKHGELVVVKWSDSPEIQIGGYDHNEKRWFVGDYMLDADQYVYGWKDSPETTLLGMSENQK